MDELLQNALEHWDTHRMSQRCGDAGITHMKVETADQSGLDLWAMGNTLRAGSRKWIRVRRRTTPAAVQLAIGKG